MRRSQSPTRSSVPLHRRIAYQRTAVRHWLVVLGLAVVTALVVSRALARGEAAERRWGVTVPVLVATRAIGASRPLAGAVQVKRRPVGVVPAGALRDLRLGARAADPIERGEIITAHRVASGSAAGIGSRERTVALPLGRAPLPVHPGEAVEVWATYDPSSADGGPLTRRVAASARVVDAGHDAVTVAVDSDDAASVARAAALATVTLVGRSGH
ncbi:MAG TPA: hypothetical protein VGM93_09565 [Acidimicrobiales bacterium]